MSRWTASCHLRRCRHPENLDHRRRSGGDPRARRRRPSAIFGGNQWKKHLTPTAAATDDDFAREIHDAVEQDELPRDRAARFYDRIRNTIQRYVDSKGALVGKTAEFLLLVPDVFILLWRLTTDRASTARDKVLLGSAVAYYIMPFDLIPEAFVGPIGYLDDLVFGVYVLNKILGDIDASSSANTGAAAKTSSMIQKVLGAAESLVGTPGGADQEDGEVRGAQLHSGRVAE